MVQIQQIRVMIEQLENDGLSIPKQAKMIGVTKSHLYKIAKGGVDPKLSTANAIEQLYNNRFSKQLKGKKGN